MEVRVSACHRARVCARPLASGSEGQRPAVGRPVPASVRQGLPVPPRERRVSKLPKAEGGARPGAGGGACDLTFAPTPQSRRLRPGRVGGEAASPPPRSLFLLGGGPASDGRACHVGLTAGEGVAGDNVVPKRPAPGAAALRPPSPPDPARPLGLPAGAPSCSPGRNESS